MCPLGSGEFEAKSSLNDNCGKSRTSTFPAEVWYHPPMADFHTGKSGNSGAGGTGKLKPSAEVASQMQPISREAFTALIRRAASSPARQPDPKAKQTSALRRSGDCSGKRTRPGRIGDTSD